MKDVLPLKTSIAPENHWLEDEISLWGWPSFQVLCQFWWLYSFPKHNIYSLRKYKAMEAWTTKLGLKSSYIIFCFKGIICQSIQLSMQSLAKSISNPLVFRAKYTHDSYTNSTHTQTLLFPCISLWPLGRLSLKLDPLTFSIPSCGSPSIGRSIVLRFCGMFG